MYAIIETGNKQYWVEPNDIIKVEKLDAKEGDKLEFKALWAGSTKDKSEGKPNAKVMAEIVRHTKGDKIIVFKKKPKTGYEKIRGHRQSLTEVKVTKIEVV